VFNDHHDESSAASQEHQQDIESEQEAQHEEPPEPSEQQLIIITTDPIDTKAIDKNKAKQKMKDAVENKLVKSVKDAASKVKAVT